MISHFIAEMIFFSLSKSIDKFYSIVILHSDSLMFKFGSLHSVILAFI